MPVHRSFRAMVLLVAVAAGNPANAQEGKKETKKEGPADLNDLSLEVDALQTLYTLKLNETQLRKLRDLAKDTAQKPGKRTPAIASKEYREKLQALRTALLDEADERIDELSEELDELRDTEKPTVDDGVDFTPAARKAAPAAVKLLTVRQAKDYLDALGDDLSDPLESLLDALGGLRGLEGKEWKERRDEQVENMVRLAAGADAARAAKLSDQLTALLSTAHGLSDEEFKQQKPKLEETARRTLTDLDALIVMRNALDHALAELLSNPRLSAALEARLKKHD